MLHQPKIPYSTVWFNVGLCFSMGFNIPLEITGYRQNLNLPLSSMQGDVENLSFTSVVLIVPRRISLMKFTGCMMTGSINSGSLGPLSAACRSLMLHQDVYTIFYQEHEQNLV